MMLHILGVLQHVYHEIDSILSGYLVVAVENFSDMSQRSCRIECRLQVPSRSTQLNNSLNNLIFRIAILVICSIQFIWMVEDKFVDLHLVQVIILENVFKRLRYLSIDGIVDGQITQVFRFLGWHGLWRVFALLSTRLNHL